MSRVGRLAGALLIETKGEYFLVGDLKEPCDFMKAGFQSPGEINAMEKPFVILTPLQPIHFPSPFLTMSLEGEKLARLLSERLLIERNGSVSDRLWRMILQASGAGNGAGIEARWLGEIPSGVWKIVRDNVLKCS